MLAKLKSFYIKYERWLIPAALVLGLLPDIFFFAFVSFDVTIITLAFYLVLAGLSIVIINIYEEGLRRGKVHGKFFSFLRIMSPLVLHFTFGALFSSFVLFYSFSGSLFSSWPFITTLLFLVVANEIFNKYNNRPDIHLSVFFFAIFSFLNLAVPYLIRDVGPLVFIVTGISSLLVMGFFIWMLSINLPRVYEARRVIIASILGVFIAMHIFYFTNLIPPIPLALRDIGAYYYAEKIGNEYRLTTREVGILEGIIQAIPIFGERMLMYQTGGLYVFSSVFAPPGMNLGISHEWQFDDPGSGWVTRSMVPFPITGGRVEGFRGFSIVSNIEPGKWRVSVKTSRGQVIGRHYFKVIQADALPTFVIINK